MSRRIITGPLNPHNLESLNLNFEELFSIVTRALENSKNAYELWLEQGNTGTLDDFFNTYGGNDAYEVAVSSGYTGTKEEWLASLKGKDAVIGVESVDYSETDFVTVGKNIFNINNVLQNKVVSPTTGALSDANGWTTNKPEPIKGGETYTQSKGGPIVFKDDNGNFIRGLASSNYASPRTFTTPTNARKMVSSVASGDAAFYQIELGSTSTTWEKYKKTVKDISVPLDDNSVTTSKIVDKNVTLDKLSVIKTGKNLFDKSRAILDNSINQTTGALYADTSKATTHVIQVTENTPYAFTQIDRVVYKDGNGKFISGEFVGNVVEMTRTTPVGAKQMQVSFLKSALDKMMVVQGTTTGAYEEYRSYLPDANVESMPFVLTELTKGAKYPSYITRTGDLIRFNYKYSAIQDAIVEWRLNGANGLFDFYRISFVDNNSQSVTTATSGTVAFTNTTDFLGPHTFLGKNNIDGTYPTGFNYTGGNHSIDNVKTARASSPVRLFVDGREVSGDFSGAGLNIEVTWANRIQAHNTFKTDGTGREVMEQRFKLTFDGVKFNIYSEIEFLEDATYKLYHGLQSNHLNMWDGTVYFHNSPNRKKNDALTKQDSGDKKCNWITLEKGSHALDIYLDATEGLGRKDFVLDSAVNGAFNMDTSKKTYFTLMSDRDFTAGDVLTFKGYYKFYSK